MDEEIEKTQKIIDDEVNKIISQDEKDSKKSNLDMNIDFDEYDEIFDLKNDKDLPDVNIDDREIKAMYAEYEKQIDKEIEREMVEEYKPYIFEGDQQRAEKLLKEDALIQEAVNKKIISKEEVITFVDYYEIFSIMNKCNKFTLKQLGMIEKIKGKTEIKKKEENEEEEEEEEYEEEEEEEDESKEDPIKKLMNEIEGKLNVTENILSKRLDYDKLLYHPGEFMTEVKEKKEVISPRNKNKESQYKESEINVNKSTASFRENNKSIITNEDLMKVPKFTANSNGFALNSKRGLLKLKPPTKGKKLAKIDLFNDKAEATNLIRARSDRRELVKVKMQNKGSRLKELFKFNPKMTKEDNQKLREKMFKLFEVEKEKMDQTRKSLIRKKIEDAQNFYKK